MGKWGLVPIIFFEQVCRVWGLSNVKPAVLLAHLAVKKWQSILEPYSRGGGGSPRS